MARQPDSVTVQVDGRDLHVSHPGKILFPDAGLTKLDLVNYYLAVAPGALRGAGGRPCILVRFAPAPNTFSSSNAVATSSWS